MTKLASSIAVLSVFEIHLVNGAEFPNVTCVAWCRIIVMLPLTKM